MRIALLTDGIWPFVIGGMQKHSYYLCKFLARNKIYVDLYHTAVDTGKIDMKSCFVNEELNYINSYIVPFPISNKFPGHYIRASYKYSKKLYELLNNNSPVDIIYAKGLTSWYMLKINPESRENIPVCINVHGYEYFQSTASLKELVKQYMFRPAFRFINQRADYIYSYGGRITDIINKYIKNRKGLIIDIPTGIEKDYLVENLHFNQVRKFVFVGRYERRKGILELMRVMQNLKDRNFELNIIGEIPDSEKLRLPNIFYTGVISDKATLKNYLTKSDILICPSYSEGMPNVILEGMATGCAIIATDVGAVSEMVNSSNGWLINPGSVVELEDAIISALELPDNQLTQKRLSSITMVSDYFLWEKIIDKLIASFKIILIERKSVL